MAGRASGNAAAVQAAVDAIGTSPNWAILQDMADEGGWPGVLWQLAAALPTDAPIIGGAPSTITETYQQSLDCERFG